MDKIKLEILDLSPSQLQAGSFTLILTESNGDRRLPIIIGMFEAQAIAIEMEKITPTRPLTHDLFKSFSKSFDFSVEEIHISDISEGVFYSKIICTDGIRQKNIDARPSDAIAIALRFNAAIYTTESVLNEAGISADDLGGQEAKKTSPKNIKVKSSSDLMSLNSDELKKMLDDAIKNEEYEKAAKIRDEIDKRN
ncbi:MAG: bifunctional nuclease family protein [Leadbetterella sp.]|nr:bifunctional nuclease family protein [Leadbetterella sp.]MBP8155665.1 bifunctional nuclease family protein [Leadbetterella sp.]